MDVKAKFEYMQEYKKSINAASGSKFDSNANVTEKNIATLSSELPKGDNIELQRYTMDYYLRKYFNDKMAEAYKEDLSNHILYRHDETTGAGGFPYCCAISLYPFVCYGLTNVGGGSRVPKHSDTFVGGLLNLIYIVAAQFAGAVAIPETLTYLDHFLRIDYGEDYYLRLDKDVVLRACGNKTLKDEIEGLFAQLTYSINQPAAARGNQSVFYNIAYFDKYYFESIFGDFAFPDGDEPKWESTSALQKLFMEWFNNERLKEILTFPVETMNLLVNHRILDGVDYYEYADSEWADFNAEMLSKGASFFTYQSDSVDSLSSCCRLRNAVEKEPFSYTLGAGGIMTGSKAVITMNVNRIVQMWHKAYVSNLINYTYEDMRASLRRTIEKITTRIHTYLTAFNKKLWDDYEAGLLTIYSADYIELDKQFLTVGVNGFVEAAEYLKINVDPDCQEYRDLAEDILGTIERCNREHKTDHEKFNLEFVPAENLAIKFAKWDKEDGFFVPRDCYNSYFYRVEDDIDPVKKFYYQGKGFADVCSGGVALHNNLSEHLSKAQYRHLMDVAVKAGCNYFTYNIPNTICNDCGYISKHMLKVCPKCGSVNLDYATRIIGYLKRVSAFSAGRQTEAALRNYAKLKESMHD